jgi:hypothetical protein
MNVDTDTQYAFTSSIAGHMMSNWNKVLKIDGGYGDKKAYDPRSWGKPAEGAMAARVVQAAQELGSAGHALRRGGRTKSVQNVLSDAFFLRTYLLDSNHGHRRSPHPHAAPRAA